MKSQNMPGKPAIYATLERKGLEIGFNMLADFEVGAKNIYCILQIPLPQHAHQPYVDPAFKY